MNITTSDRQLHNNREHIVQGSLIYTHDGSDRHHHLICCQPKTYVACELGHALKMSAQHSTQIPFTGALHNSFGGLLTPSIGIVPISSTCSAQTDSKSKKIDFSKLNSIHIIQTRVQWAERAGPMPHVSSWAVDDQCLVR